MFYVQLLLVLIFAVTDGHAGATCTLYTCNGVAKEIYCANGCCDEYGAVYCCPNTTIAAVGGTVAGFLLFLLVATGVTCYLRYRRHKQYHSISVQTQDKKVVPIPVPTNHNEPNEPEPILPTPPSDEIREILNNL